MCSATRELVSTPDSAGHVRWVEQGEVDTWYTTYINPLLRLQTTDVTQVTIVTVKMPFRALLHYPYLKYYLSSDLPHLSATQVGLAAYRDYEKVIYPPATDSSFIYPSYDKMICLYVSVSLCYICLGDEFSHVARKEKQLLAPKICWLVLQVWW